MWTGTGAARRCSDLSEACEARSRVQRHGPHGYECAPGPCSGLSRRERVKRARSRRESAPPAGLDVRNAQPGARHPPFSKEYRGRHERHPRLPPHGRGPYGWPTWCPAQNHVGQPQDARHTHCTALHSDPRVGVGTCGRGRGQHGVTATFLSEVCEARSRVQRHGPHGYEGMSVPRVRAAVSAGGNA